MHLIHIRVVGRLLAIVGQTHAEDHRVDAVKQVEPFPSLRPLASNIMNPEYHILRKSVSIEQSILYVDRRHLDVELDLDDARGPDPGVEDVLGGGDVAVLAQPGHVLQEILGAVRQLILVGPQEGRLRFVKCQKVVYDLSVAHLYSAVLPQPRHYL